MPIRLTAHPYFPPPAIPAPCSGPAPLPSGAGEAPAAGPRGGFSDPPGLFERLVQIWLDNEKLFDQLRTLDARRDRARDYLTDPGCKNEALGEAVLNAVNSGRRSTLARIRTNRLEARRILVEVEGGMAVETTRARPDNVQRSSALPVKRKPMAG